MSLPIPNLHDGFRSREDAPVSRIPISNDKYQEYQGKGRIPYIVAENDISDINYYIAQYDGAISYVDVQVGSLINSLKSLGLLRNTLIIIVADHGEMLGEHDNYFDHATCYENNIRVPLIVVSPKLFPEGKVILQQVSLIDIVPTILDVMGINIPSYVQGKSLLDTFKKDKSNLHHYVFTSAPSYSGRQISIRSENWKLIKDGTSYELYNLLNDPQEQYNLIEKEPEKFKELRSIFERYQEKEYSSQERRDKPLTDAQKEALINLGYTQ